jgi:hypothetical protein
MIRRIVSLIPAFALLVACHDSFGPPVTGRWAAPGIEFQALNGAVELRLPCARPFHLSPFIRFTGEPIEFSGRVGDLGGAYDFAFRGQLVRDTLVSTVFFPIPNHEPVRIDYRMTTDGDAGLDRQGCLG